MNSSTLYLAFLYLILALVLVFLISKFTEFYLIIVRRMPPYVSTERAVYKAVKEYLQTRFGNSEMHIVELGCGDCRGLRYLTAADSRWRASGYELALFPYLLSWIGNRLSRNSRIELRYQDFFKADLSSADAVYAYLFNSTNLQLQEKLLRELKPGAIVFSYAFTFPGMRLIKTIETKGMRHRNLYVYEIA